MNQYLKNIQDLLQQNKTLSDADKEALLKSIVDADKQWNITDFKLDRTEKVKKTTAILLEETIEELEQKRKAVEAQNRELEIESSLEKVRSIAMSMKESADMLDVCKTISLQLQSLGVTDIRNVQTAIFYESRGVYMNYEFYAKHDKKIITETSYTNHKIHQAFADQMLKGKGECYSTHIDHSGLKDWITYQKTTNVFIDTFLETAASLNYYWFSLGPVALGISTYVPLEDKELALFKRFLNVFELAYRRYLDIEKAIAQAKEAKIEASLERVRAKAMSMHHSDELDEVLAVLFDQFDILGIASVSTHMTLIDLESNTFTFRETGKAGHRSYGEQTVAIDSMDIWKDAAEKWRTSKPLSINSLHFPKESLPQVWQIFQESFASMPENAKIVPEDYPDGIYHTAGNCKFGYIGMNQTKKATEEEEQIVLKFATEFGRLYQRFLDLQKAEEQAREAKIEAALERTRTQSMIMQHSNELDDTLRVFHEQVLLLGIHSAFSFLWLPDEKNDRHIFWAAWKQNENDSTVFKSKAINYPLDRTEPATAQCLVDWKGTEPIVSYQVPPAGVESYFAAWQELIDGVEQLKPKYFSDGLYYVEAFMKYGCFGVIVATDLRDDEKKILGRFAIEFERTYTRFLDLQKAEAQAREAQIEAALERVRSRSMGMQKSEELKEVIKIVYQQLTHLKINLDHTGFVVDYTPKGDWHFWIADEQDIPSKITHPYFESVWATQFNKAKEKGEDFFATNLNFEEKNKFYNELLSYVPGLPEATKDFYLSCTGLAASTVLLDNVGLYIENFSGIPYSDEENNTLLRFGKVFQQTYTRFLDLQKAEAQVREAQIEAALEKVRSSSLAMHKSEELGEVVIVLFDMMNKLGIKSDGININVIKEGTKDFESWLAAPGQKYAVCFHVAYFTHPVTDHIFSAIEEKKDLLTQVYSFEEKNSFFNYLYKHTDFKNLPEERKRLVLESKSWEVSIAFAKNTALSLHSYSGKIFSENENEILKRFAKVFEQSYTRFLDLKKAEAQAREAQIEAALERVRSRALAMHQSNELEEVIMVVSEQLQQLQFRFHNASFVCYNEQQGLNFWLASPGQPQPYLIEVPYLDNPVYTRPLEALKNGADFVADVLTPEENHEWLNHLLKYSVLNNISEEDKKFLRGTAGFARSLVLTKHIILVIGNYAAIPYSDEQNLILKRFGNVFEQAYTRFLDLQKAEAQAREAQIEASLERVRSKTMAMHNSQDVGITAAAMFDELVKLGVDKTIRCGIGILDDRTHMEVWTASSSPDGKVTLDIGKLDMTMHPLLLGVSNAWKKKEQGFSYELAGKDLINYYTAINNSPDYHFHTDIKTLPAKIIHNDFFFPDGSLFAFTHEPLPAETSLIFKRFAAVFGQTYRRFLDLQKAEAQARESQIEAALERVRSRTLAMQKSDELAETAAVLFRQLINLGIAPNRLFIGIIKDESGDIEAWATNEDGSKVETRFMLNAQKNISVKKMFEGWKKHKKSLTIDLQGEELNDYFHYLGNEIHVPFKDGLEQKRRVQNIAYFGKGFIGIASPEPQPEATSNLLERFAAVFNLTYTRFNDLKIAEAHAIQAEEDLVKLQTEKKRAEDALNELQATQKQLIQSEKMASLGELTAGIAHEIQNPLNFVNNFSEVSNELIDEMITELGNDNKEDAMAIAEDVKQNLEKILHHGKRADGIVKGMLQHSRSSSATKEPTDINKLADEYLRLAYHGLRAKDKSFNASMKTDYDEGIGNINIIPQDIGRVILNLITNAFYAVTEKKKQQPGYEPIVTVATRSIKPPSGGLGVLIIVKDNGNGIPQKVLDKIFQPFFTTKPTGQGTGLGLSLSYDIIKAHGGEIKVESKEGEGTAFIIELPSNQLK